VSRAIPREGIDRVREVIARRLGLWFDDSRLDFLIEIVSGRLGDRWPDDVGSYLESLDSADGRAELGVLADRLTVAESYFFRYADHFRAFADLALPERLQARGRPQPVRILSAGCASGEEAYSLGIIVHERLGPGVGAEDVRIHAIDVSPDAIRRARRARYSAWSLRATPHEIQRRYFWPEGGEFSLARGIRQMVTFEERNLIDPDPAFWMPEALDIVFLRNVTMYLAPEAARVVVARIARSLAPGGYLFLGHAETLRGISNAFQLRHTHDSFYYQRRPGTEPAPTAPVIDRIAPGTPPPIPADDPLGVDTRWADAIRQASERIAVLAGPARESTTPSPSGEPPPVGRPPDLGRALEFLRQERFADAMEALGAAPPASTRSPDTLLVRAVILTNAGNLREAEEVCRAVLAIDDLNAGAHYVMALCREHDQDLPAALGHDQTAIYLDPAFAMPHLHRGLMARRQGDDETARRHLRRAADLLTREDPARVLLFGGGFSREALVELCRSALRVLGERR
jgi:chemotaxis protein methyltransferase CheR